MNNSQGALHFQATLDYTQLRQGVDAIRRDIMGLNNTVQQQTRTMDSAFKNLAIGIGSYFSAQALGGFVREVINVRGEFQKTEIAFGTMLGSQEKAQALMGQMVDLAAKTPFSLQDVSAGAKQLLAFQVPANEVVDTLTRMGNIAAGLGVPLERINLVYGQVKAKGRLMGDDLRQFTEAGIPMVAELAKKFNTSTSAITEMVTAGKIGFKDVQDVLFSLTNEGGMFYNLMEKQSKSLSGQVSNLGDAWDQMLNKIGQANEGILMGGIQEITDLVENYQDVIKVLEGVVAMYGAYRAALIITSIATKSAAANEAALASGQATRSIFTNAVTAAQQRLNATLLANPYALAMAALAGLLYVIVQMAGHVSAAEQAQERYNNKLKEAGSGVIEQKTKIETLVSAIKNENSTNEQRASMLEQIKRISNGRLNQLTVEAIRTGEATAAINEYINALDREARAKAKQDILVDNYKRMEAIKSDLKEKKTTVRERLSVAANPEAYKKYGKEVLENPGAVALALKADEYNVLVKQNNEIKKDLAKSGADVAGVITSTGESQESAIKDSAKKIKNTVNTHTEEVEKIYGTDTIKGLQQRISKLNEVMDTSVFGSEKYNNAKSQKSELEARLKEMTAGFDEQISEMQRQFEVRDNLIANGYSKDSVDDMFPKLKDENLISKLKGIRIELQALADSNNGTSETANNLFKISEVIDKMEGKQSVMEKFTKSLEDGIKGKSSQEYIEWLREQKKFLDDAGASTVDLAKNVKINEQIRAEKEAQQAKFDQLLEEQRTYEEKSLALQKEYDEAKKLAKNDDERAKVDKAFSKKFTDLFFEQMQGSDEWAKVFTDMNEVATQKLEQFKTILQQKLSDAKTIEEKIKIGEFIKKIDDTLSQRNPFIAIKEAIKAMGDESLSAEQKIALLQKGIASANQYLDVLDSLVDTVGSSIDTLGGNTDNAMGDVLNGIRQTIEGIREAMQDFEDLKEAQKAYADAKGNGSMFGQVMSGLGMVGAAARVVSGAIKAVSGWLSGDNKKERSIKQQAAALKELENAYNRVEYAAKKAFGAQKYDGQRDLIRNLEQQKAAINGMMATENSKKKKDASKIADYKNQIQTINQSIEDLKEGIIKDVLQTEIPDMASKLGDALVDAFQKGGIAGVEMTEDINKSFDDMMRNIMRNQLNLVLQQQMKPIYDKMLNYAGFNKDGTGSFNGFDASELADLKNMYLQASEQGKAFIQSYSEIFKGISDDATSQAQGLKGSFQSLTEKTGGALEAQFNGTRIIVDMVRVNQVNGLELMRSQLLQLSQIESHARNLIQIRKDISELNQKTKGQLAGI